MAVQVDRGFPVCQTNEFHPSCGHRIISEDTVDTSKLPLSYQSNTPKEEHLLQVADNFSRQYSHLCPDRVPLFLHPLNECKVPVRPGLEGRAGGLIAEGGGRGARAQPSCEPELIVRKQHPLKGQQAPAGWV